MDRANRQQRYLSGEQAEALACQYLLDQGLQLIDKNFRSRRGEIDLIMQDNGCIVFVEVRFRRSQAFGRCSGLDYCQEMPAADSGGGTVFAKPRL
jgi:uncharacterized protein (TIGR00252 family)